MSRVFGWLAGHATTLIAAAVAFLAGVCVMLPMGWKLPESAAALLGAVIGAVATIGGAVLLWQVQERQRSHHLARSICQQFADVLSGAQQLLQQLRFLDRLMADPSRHLEVEAQLVALAPLSTNLERDVARTRAKLDRFSQSLHLLTSEQVADLMRAEAVVDRIQPLGERVATWFTTGEGSTAVLSIGSAVNDAHIDLKNYLDCLRECLQDFGPRWDQPPSL